MSLLLFRGRRFSTRMIWRKGWIEEPHGRMNASGKWMILRFKPHQITSLPKRMFFKKLFFKPSSLLNGYCSIQVRPPNSSNANDPCLLFCLLFFICVTYGLLWMIRTDKSAMIGVTRVRVWPAAMETPDQSTPRDFPLTQLRRLTRNRYYSIAMGIPDFFFHETTNFTLSRKYLFSQFCFNAILQV